jgi:hypothetical protein
MLGMSVAFYHPTGDEAVADLTATRLQIPYLCQTDASHPPGTLLRAEKGDEKDDDYRSTE